MSVMNIVQCQSEQMKHNHPKNTYQLGPFTNFITNQKVYIPL